MAKSRTRTVQTCSLCEKTGHNKRRCSSVTKLTVRKAKSVSSKPIIQEQQPRVIHTKSLDQKSVPKQHTSATTKHYVPVVLGKKVSGSEHIVDLSKNETRIDPTWDAIQSFREKLSETVDRRTVDFAASIRASKKYTRATATIKKRRLFRAPSISLPRISISLPRISIPSVHIRIPKISLPHTSIRRYSPAVFALLFLIALPLPVLSAYQNIRADSAYIVSASTDAFASLQRSTTAAFQADTEGAQLALQDALAEFAAVEEFLDHDYRILVDVFSAIPFIGDHVSSRRAILNAGQHIALGNTYVIKGVADAQLDVDIPMTERLAILTAHIEQALPQYEEGRRELVSVNINILPEKYQPLFEEFLLLYSTFIDDIGDLADLSHVLHDVFGGDAFHRYLILFQNHHEVRPTGGFIGSFAMLDTQKGRIENIDIPGGGSYDIQGQFDAHIVPPSPLQLVNDRWEFQDSNWFFDFPTSARKAESFVEEARGTTFDGTIAVNASVIERVLRVIGPVTAKKYDVLLDAENILPTLQHHVEGGYIATDDEAPKEVLSQVLDTVLDAIQSIEPEQLIVLLRELHEALGQKEIQIALKDTQSHARIASFGWTGEIVDVEPRQDYLAVVATNVQGQKSDARITQEISHDATVQENGSVIVNVHVKRDHSGDPYENFYGAANITYMRVYVPQGSVLLDAGGFVYPPEEAFHVPEDWYTQDVDLQRIEQEVGIHKKTGTRITNEFGKTSYGNWMITAPGESQDIWFTYQLPFSVVDKKRVVKSICNATRGSLTVFSLCAKTIWCR